jgi:hypothetical protein
MASMLGQSNEGQLFAGISANHKAGLGSFNRPPIMDGPEFLGLIEAYRGKLIG